ncbi:MAG: hypothetical protein HY244_13770 [Rhizobiales bacterium]|nr:hypothetical protein [Hyphomicrobiales bacterium]
MPLLKNTCKAWIDKQPSGPNKLIVIGTYEAPTGGYKVTLTIPVTITH